ncbi:olfactory receptor 52E8-like [Lepisosteus oculatus]|uniref:olfactory receptor 52E8-like n=1 Tax=Lepisosteus oculatus TaxID=7918 RepID=UPI00371A3789
MQNSTNMTMFFLTAYGDNSNMRYLYFTSTLLGFLFILFANLVIIAVIASDHKLHEPMYIFICCLALNGLYGSCAFYPSCMANLLSETPAISRTGCFIQIFCLHTYGCFEYSILALMAYDRYLSICHPLIYNSIMTPSKMVQFLVFVFIYPICFFCIHISLTIRLPLCGFIITKVFCDNWSVVRLSCVDASVNNVFGLCFIAVVMITPIFVVLYSYIRILAVCVKTSKEARSKALETCTPHLLAFVNYNIAAFFEVVQHRFDLSNTSPISRIIMSVDFILLPPLLNPIIYGIKMQEIRKRIRRTFFSTKPNYVEV